MLSLSKHEIFIAVVVPFDRLRVTLEGHKKHFYFSI